MTTLFLEALADVVQLAGAVITAADQYLEAENHLGADPRLDGYRHKLLEAIRAFEDATGLPFDDEGFDR